MFQKMLIMLCVLCVSFCAAKAQTIEDPNNALVVKMRYGSWRYTYHYTLDDFTYNPETNHYYLTVEGINNRLVNGLHFIAEYDLDMPAFIGFQYGFDVGRLPNPFPTQIWPDAEVCISSEWPEWGDSAEPTFTFVPEFVEPMLLPVGREVYFQVDMSPILLPLSDNYYLQRGVEGKVIDGTPQSDKSIVHSIHRWPSYYGMTDWMCSDAEGTDHLIQGGLIEVSCEPGDCFASVSWTITDWWMPDNVNRMFMTQECLCSDYTGHAGLSSMRVGIEDKASPKFELKEESECEINVVPTLVE